MEHLRAVRVGHGRVRVGTAAPVGDDAHPLTRLGLDGEFDPVEVSELLPRWSRQGLHAGEFPVGAHALDVLDGDVVEGDEEGKLVDGHVLEHALGIALKALPEGFGSVPVVCNDDDDDDDE